MIAIAIDVGVKNLGICAYDFVQGQVVHWDNVSLVSGKYIPANNVLYVRKFIEKHQHLFGEACVVIIERQMRCNMRIIEAVLQSIFFDRAIVIAPRCVKAHYGLSTRNYRANKVKAVEWAIDFLANNPNAFARGVDKAFVSRKKDDLADSLLLVMYYLDTYSNMVSV